MPPGANGRMIVRKKPMKMIRITAAAILLLSLSFLFGCEKGGAETTGTEDFTAGSTTTRSETDPPALLSASGFTVEGDALSTAVPNATAEFSFEDRFTVTDGAVWTVRKDDASDGGTSYRFPLAEGDNRFTLTVTEQDASAQYRILIRRRPIYTVTFDANGGTAVSAQKVEEGNRVSVPTATRVGYAFAFWDHDLTQPVTGDLTVRANWTPDPDTPYTVEYYLQNAAGSAFEKAESETAHLCGTTDSRVAGTRKVFAHYAYSPGESVAEGAVAPDGSLVLKLYYVRETYSVTFDGDGGTLRSGSASQTVRYGNSAVAPTFTRNGYVFAGWDDSAGYGAVESNLTVRALWTAEHYTVSYDPDGGTLGGTDPASYTIESDVTLTPPTRSLYEFAGWYDQSGVRVDNLAGHFGNLTLTARWTSCFTVSEDGEITGISSDYRASVTRIVIPAESGGISITSIGARAFAECPLLESVTVPEGIDAIGEGTFADCPSLTEVIWNAVGCSSAGSDSAPAFAGCDALSRVTFGNGVTVIPAFAFLGCKALSSVTLGQGVVEIGDWAFSGCSSLAAVVFPEGLTTIGSRVFSGTALTSVTIPDLVTSIGSGAFENCSVLASAVIGGSVASIGPYAFRGTALSRAEFFGGGEWYAAEQQGAASGVDLAINDPTAVAAYLKNEYSFCYWYKK